MKIEDFLRDYMKHEYLESLNTKFYLFTFGTKILNNKRFLSKKINECIFNGSQIKMIRKKNICYGPIPLNKILEEKQNDADFGYYIDYFNKEHKNPSEWKAIIRGPKGSIYENGFYIIKIIFPYNYYPFPDESKPSIYFMNKIFHPHIYKGSNWDGNCCIRILKNDIKSVLEAVENMLINYNINVEYGYDEEPRHLLLDKKEDKFIEKAKAWVQEFAKFKDILKYMYM